MIDWTSVAWIAGMIVFVWFLMWVTEMGGLFVAALFDKE